tara:strand:+ start:321 stop:1244 length:924 start_codon:yes stop_codon:yes gene_type:complete
MIKIIKKPFSLLQNAFLTFIFKLKPKFFYYQSFNLFQHYPAKPKFIGLELTKKTLMGEKGETIFLPNDVYQTWWMMKYGEIKYPISKFISKNLTKRKSYVFIDIGANAGLVSREIYRNNKNVEKIICVEPVKETFECLEKNSSNFKKKLLFNFGLGQKDSTEKIYIDRSNYGNSSLSKGMMGLSKHKKYTFEKIKIKSVPNFFKKIRKEIEGKNLIIKIDVQLYDELIFSLIPEKVIAKTDLVCLELTRKQNLNIPKISLQKFRRNVKSFKKVWSDHLGKISPEYLIEITYGNKKIKDIETDIYLSK